MGRPILRRGTDERGVGVFKTADQMKRSADHTYTRDELARMPLTEFEINRAAIEGQMRTTGIPDGAA